MDELFLLIVNSFRADRARGGLCVQSLYVGLRCCYVIYKVEDGGDRVTLLCEVVDGGVVGRQDSLCLL